MIRVEHVIKRYGSHVALDGVNLTIGRGETFGLLGSNGAGKSTLVGLIATLKQPDAGRILVGGCDTVHEREMVRQEIGLVFQEIGGLGRARARRHRII